MGLTWVPILEQINKYARFYPFQHKAPIQHVRWIVQIQFGFLSLETCLFFFPQTTIGLFFFPQTTIGPSATALPPESQSIELKASPFLFFICWAFGHSGCGRLSICISLLQFLFVYFLYIGFCIVVSSLSGNREFIFWLLVMDSNIIEI